MDTGNKLDKKLDELFSELITNGTRIPMVMLDIHAKMGHPFLGQEHEAWQGREMAKWYVKQAFKDAGWIMISPEQQKAWDKADRMFREPGDNTELMTGQEWYDKFEKELPRLGEIVTKEYNDGYADAVIAALTAAKKAAGIE